MEDFEYHPDPCVQKIMAESTNLTQGVLVECSTADNGGGDVIHSTLSSNTSPQRVLNNKGVGAGYIYRRVDYFFISDRQACFVGA